MLTHHSCFVRARAAAFACLICPACRQKPEPVTETVPSPNASILPAPLASAGELVRHPNEAHSGEGPVGMPVDSAGRPILLRAEPTPPKRINVAEPLPRDRLTSKDAVGLTLSAAFVWSDVPAPAAVPEVDVGAITEAKNNGNLAVIVDLAYAGRMRLSIESPLFPLPGKTEFRGRSDWFGHVLIWPNGTTYRTLAPGSIRALFAERRPDAAPVVRGKPVRVGAGTLLGLRTVKTQVSTNVGTATLSDALVEGSGDAGKLLCRFLVDFIGLDPATDACADDRVPLRVDFSWKGGGRLAFSVTAMENRQNLPLPLILVPPPSSEFRPGELPPPSSGVFLTREELAAFRKRAAPAPQPGPNGTPGEGLLVVNHTDMLRYVLLDGVPVAWIEPHRERYIIGPKPGRYAVAWRDFLGTTIDPPELVQLPARLEIGTHADAASPH